MTLRRTPDWQVSQETMERADAYTPEKNWRAQARCARGYNPRLFFPEEGSGNSYRAIPVCANCPVLLSCLAAALAWGEGCYGIWGGTTESQRRAFRRKQAAAKRALAARATRAAARGAARG